MNGVFNRYMLDRLVASSDSVLDHHVWTAKLDGGFPLRFGGWVEEDGCLVREAILVGGHPQMGEPGLLEVVEESMETMLMEDVGGAKDGNHTQETKLAFVKDGSGWESARQIMDGSSRA